jgi:hypothetical protein
MKNLPAKMKITKYFMSDVEWYTVHNFFTNVLADGGWQTVLLKNFSSSYRSLRVKDDKKSNSRRLIRFLEETEFSINKIRDTIEIRLVRSEGD